MTYSLEKDRWLSVPNSWRPNTIESRVCWKFMFHHLRPADWKVVLAESSGPHKNETQIIEPNQVSLIAGFETGFFKCITVTSNYLDKERRIYLDEYLTYHKLGQAKFWHLDATNFFQSKFEVFNGPNPVDISTA
jgi:hypothetical protein